MDLEDIMLAEISQIYKDKYSIICRVLNVKHLNYIQREKWRFLETERRGKHRLYVKSTNFQLYDK